MANFAHTMALFNDFDGAALAIQELKLKHIAGFSMKNVTIKSPIEHLELSEMLGKRPVYVQVYTLFGSVFGALIGFILIASAQANFLVQIRGGRPLVPIPPDMVITYELFILCGVLMTIVGCFIGWKLSAKRSPLYNVNISVDKIAIVVKAESHAIPEINAIFARNHSLEIIGD